MTDWTKVNKRKQQKKYLVIIAAISVGVGFFIFFDVQPNEAMGKTLAEIQDLSEIENLQTVIFDQYEQVSLMIENGTDDAVIKDYQKEVTKNLKSLDKLVDGKKSDYEKRKLDKEVWKQQRTSDVSIIQSEIDCPNHPSKIGHLVFDPNKIEDAIYDRCFQKP